jgi:type II secretory pathway predicted ATPase ExeA
MLHRHAAHNEAVARTTWCIAERAIGVITGEVGAGKTVSVRTVLASLDASRHTIIYLPNPMIGIRGLHEMIVATFGGQPDRSAKSRRSGCVRRRIWGVPRTVQSWESA